ncbi:MAG: hypothetical protein ACI9S8_000840 [Chlamydiales bacterium]
MGCDNGTNVSSGVNEDVLLEEIDEQDFLMSKLQIIKSYKQRKKMFFNLSSISELEEAE